MTVRRGVRLGVDAGGVRIGVARCDPDGVLATPVETVPAADSGAGRVAEIARELDVFEVVVGFPVSMSGSEGPAAERARDFARELAGLVDVPVRLVDERLTTVEATRGLQASGLSSREGRRVVDQASAVVILHHALETERRTGRPAGEIVEARS
mgnify:CR=1 FL=1